MIFRIFHHDTQGLHNDAIVLKNELEALFFKVEIVNYDEITLMRNDVIVTTSCNTNIFLEHILESALKFANENIFVPNLEWCLPRDVMLAKKYNVTLFSKTPKIHEILISKFKNKVIFVGWTSIDRLNTAYTRKNQCLHLRGVSKAKNTQLLLDVYLTHPEWPTLHIVSNDYLQIKFPIRITDNIILHQYKLTEDELHELMNSCMYHICPSITEGFGHYINEAASIGAHVITTNGVPMNELIDGEKIEVKEEKEKNLGKFYNFSNLELEKTLEYYFKKFEISNNNRKNFLLRQSIFKNKICCYFKK